MRRVPSLYFWFIFYICAMPVGTMAAAGTRSPKIAPVAGDNRLALHENWRIQSSCEVHEPGEQISQPGFHSKDWHAATVPTTVVAALVADKTYPDPFFGTNLRKIPGTTYPPGRNFAHMPMPQDSPYHCSWWYRTEFKVPPAYRGRNAWLKFDGINYRANIWLNGKQVAEQSKIQGAFRAYEFEVHENLRPGQNNALAVEVFAPEPGDLANNWVDWNPMPPDKNMGVWRPVWLRASGEVALRHPFVKSEVSASLDSATLSVIVDARNASNHPISGTLKAAVAGVKLQQPVELAAGEVKQVVFSSDAFPQLKISNPKLWWPYPMGTPNLYSAHLEFATAGSVSDQTDVRFGIRQITSELTDKKNRLFRINGRPLLIRGGGWSPDMLWRQTPERLRNQFRYVQHLHLNTIRLEGKMETDDFFNLADEKGILVMAGWCCCDIWEQWDKWQPETHPIATESLRSQLLRLRPHPSMLVWLYGSDGPPPAEVEKEYLQVVQETLWPNPTLSSASADPTVGAGDTGVKMSGPYDYVPPSYWLNQTAASTVKLGGGFSFNTETSPGPAIPVKESLLKMLPADHLVPGDSEWNFHAGGQEFSNTKIYDEAMKAIYGPPADLDDYLRKSQAMAYDGERAMFEAYGRNKYTSTGVIQWMLNNAWPSLIWHLYDYYLEPAGGFFGARKANEPLHVQYSYDDRSVVVVNSQYQPFSKLKVSAEAYDFDLKKLFSNQAETDVVADSSTRVFSIPETAVTSSATSFVRLRLEDAAGRTLSSNFYWLPAKSSSFDWEKTTFFYTPSPAYEDLTALNNLPQVKLESTAHLTLQGDTGIVTVQVKNPMSHLAFQVSLRVLASNGDQEILPVLWDDNYFSLMPGESRTVSATFDRQQLQRVQPEVKVSGWNILPETRPVSASPARKKAPGAQARKS
jgi:exo-1,4-beta-D-glucosaminidase